MKSKRAIVLAVTVLAAALAFGNLASASASLRSADRLQVAGANPACEQPIRLGATMREAGFRMRDVVTDLLGIPAEEVAERRSNGESIADIAASVDVDVDSVVDTALAQRAEALEEMVANGDISREQADAALERMRGRLTERVTSAETGPRGACGGPGAGRGFETRKNMERGCCNGEVPVGSSTY